MAFWNEKIETMPREELEKLQLSLLKAKVREMYDKSPFFHDKMREAGVLPENIDSFEAFRKVPFMRKSLASAFLKNTTLASSPPMSIMERTCG